MIRGVLPAGVVRRLVPLALLLCLIPDADHTARGRADDPGATEAVRLERSRAPRTIVSEGIGPAERVVVREGGVLHLEVRVRPKDSYTSLGRRYLVDLRELSALRALNGEALPDEGRVVLIPYASLSDEYKVRAIRALFPEDGAGGGDWIHRVGEGRIPAAEESLWHLALWLTGRGENFAALADRNDIPGLSPKAGQTIRIPGELLLPAFARRIGVATGAGVAPPAEESVDVPEADQGDGFTEAEAEPETTPEGTARPERIVPPAEGAELLAYGEDAKGRHAIYRLRRGEALYSAVVIRYTGRAAILAASSLTSEASTRPV